MLSWRVGRVKITRIVAGPTAAIMFSAMTRSG
jgi:hypothetical protein